LLDHLAQHLAGVCRKTVVGGLHPPLGLSGCLFAQVNCLKHVDEVVITGDLDDQFTGAATALFRVSPVKPILLSGSRNIAIVMKMCSVSPDEGFNFVSQVLVSF